jgi:hypothetical protein
MINQEEIFQAIQKQNWDYLISALHKNKKDIATDSLLTHAAKTFVSEFLRQVDTYPIDRTDIIENLETLWVIDKGKYYALTADEAKSVTCQIVKRKKDKLVEAYNYAKLYPDEPICIEVIETYEKLVPKNIEHSQSHRITVTERKEIANVDYTTNLFKSGQEIEFFYALKRTFEMYQIYPNVSISCLLNWGLLKNELTDDEKRYFFTGIIDFVIFDQAEGFKPLHFFELDSPFHDNPDVQKKDKMKDSILAKAGVKIIRIRKQDRNVNEQEFIKLIRELMKSE